MRASDVVFLFDVDNTLLDNDRVTADLRRYHLLDYDMADLCKATPAGG